MIRVQPLSEVPTPKSVGDRVNEAIDHAFAQRPDLQAAVAGIREADAQRKEARAAFYPSLSLQANPTAQSLYLQQQKLPWAHTSDLDGGVALSLNWTVFDGGARKNRLAKADAEIRSAQAHVSTARDRIEDEVWIAYSNLNTAFRQREAATVLLDAASQSYAAALESYNYGVRSLLDVTAAQKVLAQARSLGGSRQKQILRFGGALVGGLVIGMGAQVFILPYIDSIGGFTVLFAAVMVAAAWFATSSPRLSYFGVQVAVAFCLINLQEFKIQTSLAVARDRVAGILLGLLMMWLAYDRLWSSPAGVEMKRSFVSTLRLFAQFTREPVSKDIGVATERSYALREIINAQFDKVRSLADGVLFEFGSSRPRDLRLRDHIRQWQPQLRVLFLMRIVSWKYRVQVPGFELPELVQDSQKDYDDRSARVLETWLIGSRVNRDREDPCLRILSSIWNRRYILAARKRSTR